MERPPHDTLPRWGEVGIHGMHRLREWDAVVTVEVPDLADEALELVVLPDGRTLPARAARLGEAVTLEPPFRAEAVNRGGGLWAVAARRILVERLDAVGDELEVVEGGIVRRARRLEGALWEVEETPL